MSTMPPSTKAQRPVQLDTPTLSRIGGFLFFAVVGWLLYRGWVLRDEHYITAERGVGYTIGIIGGSLMLLLLLYPVRKNWRPLRNWGPLRYWFRVHMVFGVLGPTLILFHANFGLGSTNSNVALFCMLLVAGSGIIGRFFYTRIHYGLYGSKASLNELGDIVGFSRGHLNWLSESSEDFTNHLQAIENIALTPSKGVLQSSGRWMHFATTGWWHRWRLRRAMCAVLDKTAVDEQWTKDARRKQRAQAKRYLKTYLDATRKVLEFNFYERLFALWHVVHLPFFLMMVLSGIVHVIAVHMY